MSSPPLQVSELLASLLADKTDGNTDRIAVAIGRAVLKDRVPRLPLPQESAAVSFSSPKTAALCFDRVWSPIVSSDMPTEISFWGGTETETRVIGESYAVSVLLAKADEQLSAMPKLPEYPTMPELDSITPDSMAAWRQSVNQYHAVFERLEDTVAKFVESVRPLTRIGEEFCAWAGTTFTPVDGPLTRITALKAITDALEIEQGVSAAPVYDSDFMREREYVYGNKSVVVAILDGLPVPAEQSLSWEQVCEFRHDADTRAKFRRLMHWLDAEMLGKPLAFIHDEVASRIDEYSKALRKHGIDMLFGSMSAMIDRDILLGSTAVLAALAHAGRAEWGLIAGAAIPIASATVKLVESSVNYRIRRSEAAKEIAFVIHALRAMR